MLKKLLSLLETKPTTYYNVWMRERKKSASWIVIAGFMDKIDADAKMRQLRALTHGKFEFRVEPVWKIL